MKEGTITLLIEPIILLCFLKTQLSWSRIIDKLHDLKPSLSLPVPSAPTNVSVDVLTSFALNVTWDPPVDNGGGVILGYIVIVNETSFEVEADVNFLVINDEEVLTENTDYE